MFSRSSAWVIVGGLGDYARGFGHGGRLAGRVVAAEVHLRGPAEIDARGSRDAGPRRGLRPLGFMPDRRANRPVMFLPSKVFSNWHE